MRLFAIVFIALAAGCATQTTWTDIPEIPIYTEHPGFNFQTVGFVNASSLPKLKQKAAALGANALLYYDQRTTTRTRTVFTPVEMVIDGQWQIAPAFTQYPEESGTEIYAHAILVDWNSPE